MAIWVRKIAYNKWPSKRCAIEDINGDAVTDLKTNKNTLSLWKIDSLNDMDSAILAIAASSQSSAIETVVVVWFRDCDLQNNINAVVIDDQNPGDTIVPDLANTHIDLCNITYKTLGELSAFVIDEILSEHYIRYPRSKVKDLIRDAYNKNRISESICSPKLLSEIQDICNCN